MKQLPVIHDNNSGLRPNISLQGPRKNDNRPGINISTKERYMKKLDANVCISTAWGFFAFKHSAGSNMSSMDEQYWTSTAFGNTASEINYIIINGAKLLTVIINIINIEHSCEVDSRS